MAKLKCKCGAQLSNVSVPNNVEGYLLSEFDMDRMSGGTNEVTEIMDHSRGLWECWQCGRLGFHFPDKNSSAVKWYMPEDGVPGKLLSEQ